MRFIVLSVFAGLAGCDLNEGPAEESREAEEAIREGKRPSEVWDQVEDVGASEHDEVLEPDLDKELREAERWAERQQRAVESGSRQADESFRKGLSDVQAELKELRAEMDRLGEKAADQRDAANAKLRESIHALSLKIDKLDGEVDDRPGRDSFGPG